MQDESMQKDHVNDEANYEANREVKEDAMEAVKSARHSLQACSPDALPLHLADLHALSMTLRGPQQPEALFLAVEALTARVIGHRLFTIMSFDPDTFEVERLHSNRPDLYPPGGRKKKAKTAWGAHVLTRCEVFRSVTPDGIRQHFDDHQTMANMGLGAILNIPIAYDGRCVGTMNMTHASGWYREAHEEVGLIIGSFLVTALLEHDRRRQTQ